MSASLRHRSGLDLARLNRRVKERNRAEIVDALLFPLAIALTVALWVGLAALFAR